MSRNGKWTLNGYLRKEQRKIEKALREALPRRMPSRLARAISYSLFAKAKRIRPILVLASCEAVGGREKDAFPAACAIEMIHTYSLIHDDLPSMDDDDFRRGKPSNHKAFDEATAILAGDALQAAAFGSLARSPKAALLTRELADASGAAGMVGGQVLDLAGKSSVTLLHELKTAALFRASTRMGAICAGAPARTVDRLGDYGRHLGLAFQAIDDILDQEGNTRPALLRARRSTERAGKAIAFLGKRGELLRRVADSLATREQ